MGLKPFPPCGTFYSSTRLGGLLDDSERPAPGQPRGVPAGNRAHAVRTTPRYTHRKTLPHRRRKAGRDPAEEAEAAPERSDGTDRAEFPAAGPEPGSVIPDHRDTA